MTRVRARMLQKVTWHLRWILLVLVMAFNLFALVASLGLIVVVAGNSIGFCLYLLLSMLDGYFECQSNCRI